MDLGFSLGFWLLDGGGEGVVVGCEYWCTHLPSEKAKIAKTPKG
jgi:hypothetical protein